jgi:hypothetical protein
MIKDLPRWKAPEALCQNRMELRLLTGRDYRLSSLAIFFLATGFV